MLPKHNPIQEETALNEIEKVEFRPAGIAETATAAQASQAQAIVQAKFAIAYRKPRDLDDVRTRLLRECQRPGFADDAEYAKPIAGAKITGPSIRLAETCVRLMGNITISSAILFEDDDKRITRIGATDLETNATYEQDITVRKVVERKNPKGRTVLSERTNSTGEKTYLVEATDDEMNTSVAAAMSKAIRTTAFRLVPGDLVEEALTECRKTRAATDAKDPDSVKKAILDAFARRGIGPALVKELVGKDLNVTTADERADLKKILTALDEGADFQEMLTERRGAQTAPPAPTSTPSSTPATAPEVDTKGNTEPSPQPGPDLEITRRAMRTLASKRVPRAEFENEFSWVATSQDEETLKLYRACLKVLK